MAQAFLLLITATFGLARRDVLDWGATDLLQVESTASGKQVKLSKSGVSAVLTDTSGEVEAAPVFLSSLLDSSPKLQNESTQIFHQSSHSVADVGKASNLSSSFIFSAMSSSTSSSASYSSSSSSYSYSPSVSLHDACTRKDNPFGSNGEEDSSPIEGKIITGSQGKQYKYIKQIGYGSFATVWSVTDDLTEVEDPKPTAAIKVSRKTAGEISDRENALLWKEVCSMATCEESSYVVTMLDLFHDMRARYYIVMEFVPGGNLEKQIKQKKVSLQTPVKLALIFYDILRGLAYIHEQGISHRDIKPENVLITADDRAKIADFGLADDATTVKRERCGSMWYFPPEIAAGSKYLGPEIDAFSLGASLYEMVTAKKAYSEETYPKPGTAYFPTSDHEALLSGVPEKIKDIIFCTQKEMITCTAEENAEGQCRCGISDIMGMEWVQEAAALDAPARPSWQGMTATLGNFGNISSLGSALQGWRQRFPLELRRFAAA